LRSVECDAACPCGYRGVIFGADGGGVCQPGHDIVPGEEGLEPHNYPRAQQIADANRIVAAVNGTANLSTEALEAGVVDKLVEALEAIAGNSWRDQSRARFVARAALTLARGEQS
jgi:hypothetical protein